VSLDTKKSGRVCASRKLPRTERVTPSKKIDQEREWDFDCANEGAVPWGGMDGERGC
jgi:hypothetical protein